LESIKTFFSKKGFMLFNNKSFFMFRTAGKMSHPLFMIIATNEGGTKNVRQRRNDIRGALLLDHGDYVHADPCGFHNAGETADTRMIYPRTHAIIAWSRRIRDIHAGDAIAPGAGMNKQIITFAKRYAYSAFASAYLFSFGFLFSKNRVLIAKISAHFGYDPDQVAINIPKLDLSVIAPENTQFQVREPIGKDGNVSLLEIVAIARLIRRYEPAAIFEIGTFDGRTTLNMAANSPVGAHVYTLDLPKTGISDAKLPLDRWDVSYINKDASGTRFLHTDCESKITSLYGDSAAFDFSPYYDKIDLIFIDGAHTYEYAMNDTAAALKMLRGGKGVLLWHDFGSNTGVTRALHELQKTENRLKNIGHIEHTSLACCIIQ
jgi:predicted O-methyltransferase YrrM